MRQLLLIIILSLPIISQAQTFEADYDKSLDTAAVKLNKAGDALLEYRQNKNLAQGAFLFSGFTGITAGVMDPGAVRVGTGILSGIFALSGIVITITNEKHLKDAAIQLKGAGRRIGVNLKF